MLKLAKNAVSVVAVILVFFCVSLSDAPICYAAPAAPLLGNSTGNDDESDDDMTNEQKGCPEAYRRYKEMEQAYHRPQMWRGCNGAYEVVEKNKLEPQEECPDTYHKFIASGEQVWKGCDEDYVSTNKIQKDPRVECPDIYRSYEELEQRTGRPQIWNGCDGGYYIVSPADQQTQDSSPLQQKQKLSVFNTLNYFKESHQNRTEISGFSMALVARDGFMAGLNAVAITAPELADYSKDGTIHSLYGYLGIFWDQPISPYAEIGFDLGDIVVAVIDQQLRDALDTDECVLTVQTGVCDTIDTYFSVGLQNRPYKYTPFVRAYAKWYFLSEDGQDIYLPVLGVSLGMAF